MNFSQISRLLGFYLIAILLSNIFRFDPLDIWTNIQRHMSYEKYVFCRTILEGIGVFIGASLSLFYLRKTENTSITLLGNFGVYGILMALSAISIFTIYGIKNRMGVQENLMGATFIISILTYCIFEEWGWRNYLQEELKKYSILIRSFIIGLMWFIWHLGFIEEQSIVTNIKLIGIFFLASIALSKLVEQTKSILVAACFHLMLNLFMFNNINVHKTDLDPIIGIIICWSILIIVQKTQSKKSIMP